MRDPSPVGRRHRLFVALAVFGSLVCLAAGDTPLARPRHPARSAAGQTGNRLYIVAVRDSRLLTLCPSKLPEIVGSQGKPLIASSPNPSGISMTLWMPRPPLGSLTVMVWETWETAHLPLPPAARRSLDGRVAPVALDSGLLTWDDRTASAVGREIFRRRKYAVVPSLAEADYVLLVEAQYWPLASFSGRRRSNVGGGIGVYGGDRETNFLDALLALMVPVEAYRTHGPNVAALLPAIVGSATAFKTHRPRQPEPYPASVETLVRHLHGEGSRPAAFPPVCAASPESVLDAGEADEVRRWIGLRGVLPVGPPPAPHLAAGVPAFTGGITYVTVPVVVRDGKGRAVTDVPLADFRVYEEDTEQKIERLFATSAPIGIALVVDTSESMRGELRQFQNAVLPFIETLTAGDRVLLASIDVSVLVHAEANADRSRLRQALLQIGQQGAGTRLYDGLALLVTKRMAGLGDRRAIVLLTDGVDTRSRLADAESTLRLVSQSHVPIYVVQYDTRFNDYELPMGIRTGGMGIRDMTPTILPEGALDDTLLFERADLYLWALAETSGGRRYRAGTLQAVKRAFAQVASDLGAQYTLGYYPSNQARDGRYRQLRVVVNRADVTVTTRAGYQAPER